MILKPPLGVQLNRKHPLARGLAGCWLMNEAAGDIINDLSGNANTGRFYGDVVWGSSIYGSMVYVTDEQIKVINPCKTGEGTIVVWISWPYDYGSAHMDRMFFGTYDGDASDLWYSNDGTHVRIWYNRTDNQDLTYYPLWEAYSWHQIAVTIKSSDSRLYCDGILRDTNSSASVMPVGGTWYLGGGLADLDPEQSYNHFSYYDRILSASEIASLYSNPFQMIERPSLELWTAATQGAVGGETYISRAAVFARTLTESMGIDDAMGRTQVQLRTVAETLGITDAHVKAEAYAIAEALGITDVTSKASDFSRTQADTVGIVDNKGWFGVSSAHLDSFCGEEDGTHLA